MERQAEISRAIFYRPRINYGMPHAWETYKARFNSPFVRWFEKNVIDNPTGE